jgi:hypothetical protein
MKFSEQILSFYDGVRVPRLPEGVVPMLPFMDTETRGLMEKFFQQYYSDELPRMLLFGINPGRLGAGKTGIGFTDPLNLEQECNIPNNLDKRSEPSSAFIYNMIRQWGSLDDFYSHFYFTSVSPVGFVKNGVNINYYDISELQHALEPYIIEYIKGQLKMNVRTDVAFSIGKGKNLAFLKKLNDAHGFFDKIEVLPHPRWVMQYRYKDRRIFEEEYIKRLGQYVDVKV